MLIGITEHQAEEALLELIKEINDNHTSAWSIVNIHKNYLISLPRDQLILSIKPALHSALDAKIFFMENEDIYIAWCGMPKRIYEKLCGIIAQSLIKPELASSASDATTYFDAQLMADELSLYLKKFLKIEVSKSPIALPPTDTDKLSHGPAKLVPITKEQETSSKENIEPTPPAYAARPTAPAKLEQTSAQIAHFMNAKLQRLGRRQLSILIVEDQLFSKKLLFEMLSEQYDVDAVDTITEAWNIYLDKAPNVVFIDIELSDGSGHVLANNIKNIDNASYMVMVTASHSIDDVETARKNNVKGFVVKPFSKQKILSCIDRYLSPEKTCPQGKR